MVLFSMKKFQWPFVLPFEKLVIITHKVMLMWSFFGPEKDWIAWFLKALLLDCMIILGNTV